MLDLLRGASIDDISCGRAARSSGFKGGEPRPPNFFVLGISGRSDSSHVCIPDPKGASC